MFTYDTNQLKAALGGILRKNLPPEAWQWLENEAHNLQNNRDIAKFNIAFVAMPRKTGKAVVNLSQAGESDVQSLRPGFSITDWSADRLSRVWLVIHLDPSDKGKYIRVIENLFLNAEMNEQVALYSALPLLAFAEEWRNRCAEGIRSNIGQVLESIMCNNPYPAEQLEESAWNQLVLKAIFTEKPIHKIVGLEERMNQKLADSFSDYAHERWSAHRTVNPLLWYCAGKFINEKIFADIQRVFNSENIVEREAAALACDRSAYKPAKQLLERDKRLKNSIEKGEVSWLSLAQKVDKIKNE